MKTINSLATLRQHSKSLEADLNEVFARYGLKVTRHAGTIFPSSGEVKWRSETSFLSPEGEQDLARKQWEQYAVAYGLPADAFGKVVCFNGFAFTIAGLNLSSRKSPVKLTRRGDGKEFKTSAESVARALASVKQPTTVQP